MSTDQADRICELREGARALDRQHVLSLAAGILHDAVNDGRAGADAASDGGTTETRLEAARVAAALGAARVAAYGSSAGDPDWTPQA